MDSATHSTPRPTAVPTLGLARIDYRLFGRGDPYGPQFIGYFADMAAQFGQPFRKDYFTSAAPNSFTKMVTEVLPSAVHPGEAFDLALVTHSTPDSRLTRPACYLSHTLAGNPLAFGVSEQGVTAPFTAIRIAGEYLRNAAFHRAMVVVLDQSFLWNGTEDEVPEGTRMPGRDAAVVLTLETGGALGAVSVRTFADVPADEVRRLVAEQVRGTDAARKPAVIAGSGVDPGLARDFPVRWAPDDLPCTGIWSEFAAGFEDGAVPGQRVALIDYDPVLRYLSLCTIDVPQAGRQPLAGA
jgi:hypothetical protein